MRGERTLVDGVPADVVSVRDRGLLYGDGAFETIRVYAGIPFRLEAHLSRLAEALRTLEIPPEGVLARLREDIASLELEGDAWLRLTVTGGVGAGMNRPEGSRTRIVATGALAPPPEPPIRVALVQGIIVTPFARKSLSYEPALEVQRRARREGAFEGIACDEGGRLLEGARSNVFVVFDREVATPPLDGRILPGVTREAVLELARAEGIAISERVIQRDELSQAKAMFLTSSLLEVLPVGECAGQSMRRDEPVIARLARAYSRAATG